MKLQEIRKPPAPESELAKEYRAWFTEWCDEHPRIIRRMVNADGSANGPEIASTGVSFTRKDGGTHHLVFPMKKSWWADKIGSTAISSGGGTAIVVDDFKEYPDCENLNLWSGVGILSFAGIENNTIEDLAFYDGVIIRCGMLRLLKMPNLKKLKLHAAGGAWDAKPLDKKLALAIDIINKHLETRDVAECMDELMEAGLTPFAKL